MASQRVNSLKIDEPKLRASALILSPDSKTDGSKKSMIGVDTHDNKNALGIGNASLKMSHTYVAGSSHVNVFDNSSALKKSTMVLSQLAGTFDHMKRRPSDPSHIDLNSSFIGQEISIGGGNVAQADRPQVWTKSTSKAAETNEARRLSLSDGLARRHSASSTVERRSSLFNIAADSTVKKRKKTAMSLTGADLKDMIQNINTLESRNESYPEVRGKVNQSSKKILLEDFEAAHEPLGSRDTVNSKASVLVESLLKNINNLGKPLRGPILRQLTLLYISYLLILFASWYSGWAPQIQFFASVSYFVLSFLALQIGRLAYSSNIGSVIPLYVSLLPFAGLVFISRESRHVVFVLWFASMSFIFLQSGHPSLRAHFLAYCTLLFMVYILAVFAMSKVYNDGCELKVCGLPLDPPIVPAYEAVILINSVFCILVLLSLEWFIKLNAIELLERDTFMTQLVHDNEALIKQLKGEDEKPEEDTSLEGPLTRATNILKQIKADQTVDRMVADEIDFILGVLSQDTDNLFVPDLFQQPTDSDVHDWLNDLMVVDKSVYNSSSIVISLKKEDPALDQFLLLPEDSRIFNFLSERLDDPEFDIFELYNLAQGKVLYYIGWHIFRRYQFADLYSINEFTFRRWLSTIESGYLYSNPYHNALHAADVTHSMHYYVSRTRIWSVLRPEEKLAVLIAPIIHDYKHPGLNNAFMISTRSPLAIRYNDLCVLESFHVSSVYELMTNDESLNIFANVAADSRKLIREMTASMVLATDMAVHFEWIGKFKSKMSGAGLNLEAKQDRKLLLNMAMKCADINNPTKKLIFCRKWTDMIMREFFAQGEEEKKRGLKVSMFMDKETTDIPKCQVGFIDFIVRPLYEAWAEFMKEDIDVHLHNINENKAFWKACADDPEEMREINRAKTEAWVPLAEAEGDLDLLLQKQKTIVADNSPIVNSIPLVPAVPVEEPLVESAATNDQSSQHFQDTDNQNINADL